MHVYHSIILIFPDLLDWLDMNLSKAQHDSGVWKNTRQLANGDWKIALATRIQNLVATVATRFFSTQKVKIVDNPIDLNI